MTRELSVVFSLVSIGVVSIHGQPRPEVSPPYGLSGRSAQSREPPARESPRRPCHWHRCPSVRRDRWSGVLRINRGSAGAFAHQNLLSRSRELTPVVVPQKNEQNLRDNSAC